MVKVGLCANGKRRYLWTDDFGVLAFMSIGDAYERKGEHAKAEKYRKATNTLVDVVHQSLGAPRSDKDHYLYNLYQNSPRK
jgi:predicted solute-binding protein